jgi:quercetin dioxygenase-like cupin family protein
MRALDCDASAKTPVGVLDVARWEQFGLDGVLPFGAMWYSVPAGQSSPQDRHPEAELSLVVSGTAWVETGGRLLPVAAGSAFLLDPDEPHTVHNRGEEPLLVFSAYWLPADEAAALEEQVRCA